MLFTRFICPIYLLHEESWCSIVSYDWANGGSFGVFLRHGMVSGLWEELELFQGEGMKFKDKIASQGCREKYCEYGPATEILCWVYDVLGDSYVRHSSGLMGSKADSRTSNP